jgi:predicted RNase H-like nuclease (RuvC/YqgF family)
MDYNEHEIKRLMTERDILEKNIFDLQQQLQNAYIKIDQLTNELIDLRRSESVNLGRS